MVVRDGCELQRIRYVSFHLWIFQICQYKHGGSPTVFALSTRKNLFTGLAVQCWNGLLRAVVQSPSLHVFMTWLDKITADLLSAGSSSAFIRMLEYRPPEVRP